LDVFPASIINATKVPEISYVSMVIQVQIVHVNPVINITVILAPERDSVIGHGTE
jgi:hypothetical protein